MDTLDLERDVVNTPNRYESIPGWGMDADPENDPTYPMKMRQPDIDHEGLRYEKAPQQPVNMKIYHSIERPGVTRVFGTSTPPSGLSGKIRDHAYRYSEATANHWMTLILADKVDVIQGIVADLKNGTIPNFFAELGWRAEWQYNRKKFLGKMGVRLMVIGLVFGALKLRNRK